MILKCIQCITKGNLLLLKDFLDPERTKFINVYKIYLCVYQKNVYIDSLADIVNRYIKMKPVDVKSSIYIDFNKEKNKEDPLNLKLISS